MFDLFSWNHVLILLAVALLVVGPRDLPKLMHIAGSQFRRAKDVAVDLKKNLEDLANQSALDEQPKGTAADFMSADADIPSERGSVTDMFSGTASGAAMNDPGSVRR